MTGLDERAVEAAARQRFHEAMRGDKGWTWASVTEDTREAYREAERRALAAYFAALDPSKLDHIKVRAECPDCRAKHGEPCRHDRTCVNCGHPCDHLPADTCIYPRCGCRHYLRKAEPKHGPRRDRVYVAADALGLFTPDTQL